MNNNNNTFKKSTGTIINSNVITNDNRFYKSKATIMVPSNNEKIPTVVLPSQTIVNNQNQNQNISGGGGSGGKYKQNYRNNSSDKRHNKKHFKSSNEGINQILDNEMQLAIEMSKAEFEAQQQKQPIPTSTSTTLSSSGNSINNKSTLSSSGNSINSKSKKKSGIDVTHLINFSGHKDSQSNNSNNHHYHNYNSNNNHRRNSPYKGNNNNNNNCNIKMSKEKALRFKENSYLQAKFSFYINPYGTYTNSLSNPDIIVSWNKIEQAIYLLNQPSEYQCPICFDPPLAPKITPCGHFGCYGCLLRNLSHTNKCPLCLKPISSEDLKSVKIVYVKKYQENSDDQIDLELIKYREGSTVPFISSKQTLPSERISFPNINDCNSTFSRFSVLYDIEDILQKEIEDLDKALIIAGEDHEYQTIVFLNNAMLEVKSRREQFKKLVDSRSPQENVVEIQKSIPRNQNIQFDSFQYGSNPEIREVLEDFYNHCDSPTNSLSDSDWDNYFENNPDQLKHLNTTTTTTTTTTATKPTNNSNNSNNNNNNNNNNDIQQPQDNINIPNIQSYSYENQPYDHVYYIYQSNDGQDIYLHPLCMKILSKEYLEKGLPLPNQISKSKILEFENLEVTKQLRQQYKVLNVVPLTTPITFIEIDLSSLVSKSTLNQFATELNNRHNHREHKKRLEQRKQKTKEKERLNDMKRSVEIKEIIEKEKLVKMEQDRIRVEQEKKELEEYQKQQQLLKSKLPNQPPIQPPKFSSVLQAITQHKNIESNIEFPTLNKGNKN